jgi:hypothetical protein
MDGSHVQKMIGITQSLWQKTRNVWLLKALFVPVFSLKIVR